VVVFQMECVYSIVGRERKKEVITGRARERDE
jgi:hypothetical protein